MTHGACFALVAGPTEAVVMLVDDQIEANEIADEMRRAGQQIDVRRYLPPRSASSR